MEPIIVSALISSILGGIIVALVNHLLTRRKTNAEIKHLELTNRKLELEIKKLYKEIHDVKTKILSKISVAPDKSINITEETYRFSKGDFKGE